MHDCYYCSYSTAVTVEYERHVITQHDGKLAYPTLIDLKIMNIAPKGQPWETPPKIEFISQWIEDQQKKEARAYKRLRKLKTKEYFAELTAKEQNREKRKELADSMGWKQ